MKTAGKTNPELINLIRDLKDAGRKNKAPVWRDIARRLSRPLNNWAEVNVGHLDRVCAEGDTVIVPGKVLAAGDIEKKINIAAWRFSSGAETKITKAGGKIMNIGQMVKKNPKGKKLRIIG